MAKARKVLVLNGPNLNLLGTRDPQIYGRQSLADIEAACRKRATALELKLEFKQSNSEGELVEWIQAAMRDCGAIVVNAGAYSHTSLALMDALQAVALPVIEVHLSNIYRREEFRRHSYISLAATGVICGLGAQGYLLALEAASQLLDSAGSK